MDELGYNGAYKGSEIDAAVGAVRQKESTWDGKQDKLTGLQGQVVGFDDDGDAIAIPAPDTGVTAFNERTGAVVPQAGDYTAEMVGALAAPEGGTEGQMLYKSADGVEWGDKPVMYVNVTMTSASKGTANMTSTQIREARNNGCIVFASMDGIFLPLVDMTSHAYFSAINYTDGDVYQMTLGVDDTGAVNVLTEIVVTLDYTGKVPASQLPDMDYIPTSQKGAASGVAELDSTGRVPSSQLPSYVDDVLEYDTLSSFPPTGEDGKIYIAEDTNLQYRWSGSQYVEISPSLALGETSSTAYRGDRGKTAYDHSQITTGNPHGTTAADVGAVPTTRTVNGHALSDNISLTAGDVGARPTSWTPTAADVGAVPTSRTVNGKALSSDISLAAADVGAATPADVNAAKPVLRTATLTTSGWSGNSQTVTVSGVVADTNAQLITVSPANKASATAWGEAGVFCSGQGANSLTFVCDSTPSANIVVNIAVQEAQT